MFSQFHEHNDPRDNNFAVPVIEAIVAHNAKTRRIRKSVFVERDVFERTGSVRVLLPDGNSRWIIDDRSEALVLDGFDFKAGADTVGNRGRMIAIRHAGEYVQRVQ